MGRNPISDRHAARHSLKQKQRVVGRRFRTFSALTRMIFLANLLGLLILIIGALTLNQFSRN